MQPKGFGRIKQRREQLEARKDNLREINRLVDWEIFRSLPRPTSPAIAKKQSWSQTHR